jgi:hypothetical protein
MYELAGGIVGQSLLNPFFDRVRRGLSAKRRSCFRQFLKQVKIYGFSSCIDRSAVIPPAN